MCRTARTSCKLIEPLIDRLCSNETLIPSNCTENLYQDLRFLSPLSEKCLSPVLVPSEKSDLWFPGIEGCAFNCTDPRVSQDDKDMMESFIFHGSLLSFLASLWTSLTFVVDWKRLNKYPSIMVFYLSSCITIVNLGFLFQFFLWSKEEIACRGDSTLKWDEPHGKGSNKTICVFSFLVIYYFSIASLVWFINICFTWWKYFHLHRSNPAKTTCSNRMKDKQHRTYFHLAAWCTPLIIIILIFALSIPIESSYLTGVCSIGIDDLTARVIFILVPIGCAVVIGNCFLIRSLGSLIALLRQTSYSSTSSGQRNQQLNIIKLIVKVFILITFSTGSLAIVIWSSIFEFSWRDSWTEELRKAVICSLDLSRISFDGISVGNASSCSGNSSFPINGIGKSYISLTHIYVQLSCFFSAGFVIGIWTFTRGSFDAWRRFFLKVLGAPEVDKVGKKYCRKDDLVREKFADQAGSHPMTPLFSAYGDPVGLNLTPLTSHEVSSDFRNGLQNLLSRRGGVPDIEKSDQNDNHYIPSKGRRLRNFFTRNKKLYPYDGSSMSEVSGFRSNTTNNQSTTSMGGESRNSRLSLEDMRELQDTAKHLHRKKRREHRRALSKLASRRASDSSFHSLASHQLPFMGARSVSQTIAARNQIEEQQQQVQQQQQAIMMQALLLYQHSLMSTPVTNPFGPLNQTVALGNSILHQQLPSLPSQTQPNRPMITRPRIKQSLLVKKEETGTVTLFSHGMIEQKESLSNPLTEVRRPDSKVCYHQPMLNQILHPNLMSIPHLNFFPTPLPSPPTSSVPITASAPVQPDICSLPGNGSRIRFEEENFRVDTSLSY